MADSPVDTFAAVIGGSGQPVPEPSSSQEAEHILVSSPLSRGYKPTIPAWSFVDMSTGLYLNTVLNDVERMLLHPIVADVYDAWKSAIHHAEFQINANSPEVKRFCEIMYDRFWTRSLDQAQLQSDYGWNGFEVGYAKEKGYLTYQGLWDFCPFDTWALSSQYRYAGISVRNVPGTKGMLRLWGPLRWPAKAFWLVHNKRWNKYYGRSQLYAAWIPWRRLAHRDGLQDVLDAGWYRYAFSGPIGRFPRKAFPGTSGQAGCVDGVNWEAAREHMRQMGDDAKAGMGIYLPGDWDKIANAYAWSFEWPQRVLELGPLLEVIRQVEDQISKGIGVPPELTDADDAAGGWSGRKIPLLKFYTQQRKHARRLAWQFKHQILDNLVLWNFGRSAKHEVDVELKIPDVLSPAPPGPEGAPTPGPAEARAVEAQGPGNPSLAKLAAGAKAGAAQQPVQMSGALPTGRTWRQRFHDAVRRKSCATAR